MCNVLEDSCSNPSKYLLIGASSTGLYEVKCH